MCWHPTLDRPAQRRAAYQIFCGNVHGGSTSARPDPLLQSPRVHDQPTRQKTGEFVHAVTGELRFPPAGYEGGRSDDSSGRSARLSSSRGHVAPVASARLTLALGIGSAVVMVDILDRLLLRASAQVTDPDRVARVYCGSGNGYVGDLTDNPTFEA